MPAHSTDPRAPFAMLARQVMHEGMPRSPRESNHGVSPRAQILMLIREGLEHGLRLATSGPPSPYLKVKAPVYFQKMWK